MASSDTEMKELLERCGCSEFLKYFSTVTKKSLQNLLDRQQRSKLKLLLPKTEEGRSAIKKIYGSLHEYVSDSEEEVEDPVIKVEIKEEIVENESEPPEAPNQDDGDDEIMILKEIPGDVSVLEVRVKSEQPDELIQIEDEDNGIIPSVYSEAGQKNAEPSTPSSQEKKRRAVKRTVTGRSNPVIINLEPTPSCTLNLLYGQHQHVKLALSRFSKVPFSFSKWNNLLRNGDRIRVIDCLDWTWSGADSRQGQRNLFHILSRSPEVEEIRIMYSCTGACDYIPPPGRLKLLNLKRLKICHAHDLDMNYQQALIQIIIAASQLQTIELEYKDGHVLRAFLYTLKGMEETHLKSIKCLSIKEVDDESVALVDLEMKLLASIQAKNLEELFLGFSLWEDTKDSLEKMLRSFIKLKRFTVQGCFNTTEGQEPSITLNFPVMEHLEYLNMGKNYQFSSILESIKERPRKRRKTTTMIRTEDNGEGLNNALMLVPTESEDETHGEFFTVTLNLPSLPKLKAILLGALYEIQDLHFGRFPSLESFRVSSPWQTTVHWPSLHSSRHPVYPKVTQLQFPDNLVDHTFVQKVVNHFPRLESCWIHLPTVKVLRAFSKVMLGSSYLRLKELDLKVQFDFASSLDWAFLEKPSSMRANGMAQSTEEFERIQVLKSYGQWEEYAKVYHIDIPDVNELDSLENEEEFRGLGSLCHRLRASLDIKINHIPRKLRLPKGTRSWNDADCEYSDVLIGFKSMEYPFSAEAWELASININVKHFKLPPKAIRVHIKDPESYFVLDPSTTVGPGKKEEPSCAPVELAERPGPAAVLSMQPNAVVLIDLN